MFWKKQKEIDCTRGCVLQKKNKIKIFTRIDCMLYHIFQITKHITSKGIDFRFDYVLQRTNTNKITILQWKSFCTTQPKHRKTCKRTQL